MWKIEVLSIEGLNLKQVEGSVKLPIAAATLQEQMTGWENVGAWRRGPISSIEVTGSDNKNQPLLSLDESATQNRNRSQS